MINIELAEDYRVILSGPLVELNHFYTRMEHHYTDGVYCWKRKRRIPQDLIHTFAVWNKEHDALLIDFGILHFLVRADLLATDKFTLCEILLRRLNAPGLVINDEWKERFENHPDEEKGQDQLMVADAIASSARGILTVYTGVGKGEIIMSCLDSTTEKVLVIVFSNAVRDELILRAEKYGILIPQDFDHTSRINILNPASAMRANSKLNKEPEFLEWLDEVDMIIGDEGHHWSANTWMKITRWVNPTYLYCFTATADKVNGLPLAAHQIDFAVNNLTSLLVVSMCGPELCNKDLPVPVDLTIIKTAFVSKDYVKAFNAKNPKSMGLIIGDVMRKDIVAEVLNTIYKTRFKTGICYVPVNTVLSGMNLCKQINDIGDYKAIFWSASGSMTPYGPTDKLDLKSIKALGEADAIDFLITTSIGVEGIDVKGLGSVIPLVDRSFRGTVQAIGRSARGVEVKVAVLLDENCGVLRNQMHSKLKLIQSRMNVVKSTSIDMRHLKSGE